MNVDDAERLGIALEIPDGDCPRCKAPRYECGTRRSVRDVCGKVVFQSAECWRRSESAALDIIRGWNEAENSFSDEGQWTLEKCPKCHARMLKNNVGDRWCSYVNCTHLIRHNAKDLARRALDSE